MNFHDYGKTAAKEWELSWLPTGQMEPGNRVGRTAGWICGAGVGRGRLGLGWAVGAGISWDAD